MPETEARDPGIYAQRERDKWNAMPPSGESYAALTQRVDAWYREIVEDTVVTAHGGTVRALMALTNQAAPAACAGMAIEQGTVYVFEGATMTKFD